EDTGIPAILRDTQVLSIWEGTTNVLSLDVLRAMEPGGVATVRAEVARLAEEVRDPVLLPVARAALRAVDDASAWLADAARSGRPEVEAGARRFALTLGRAQEAALLAAHAEAEGDAFGGDAAAAARRLARNGLVLIHPIESS
ncbi:MAG TPA: hypothetical protein VM759_01930, partial [Longimicrobium sp.]|nr:hypothetical protein [Longimicrobium sp.]